MFANKLYGPKYKACRRYAITILNWTHVFDWCVVGRGTKNKHHK